MWRNRAERFGLKLGEACVYLGATLAVALIFLPLVGLVVRATWGQIDFAVWQALRLSLLTTAFSLGVILLCGTPLAWVLSRFRFRGRRELNTLIELPIVLPPAVAGLALLVTLGRRGLVGAPLNEFLGLRLAFTPFAVVIAQVFVSMPFYVRAAQIGFSEVDCSLEEAARVDGASAWGVFWRVSAPLARSALLSGAILSWARALGEFGATIIFAGSLAGKTRTMPLLVYHELERDLPNAIWTGLILLLLAGLAGGLARWQSELGEEAH